MDLTRFKEGVTLLKFGRRGSPHKKVFKLSKEEDVVTWDTNSVLLFFSGGERGSLRINRITGVMKGQNSSPFGRCSKTHGSAKHKELSMTINYTTSSGVPTTLDIICQDGEEQLNYLYESVTMLFGRVQAQNDKACPDDVFFVRAFEEADTDKNKSLSKSEVYETVSKLNLNMNKTSIDKIFKLVDTDDSNTLDRDEFVNFMNILMRRIDLELIWESLLGNEGLETSLTEFPTASLDSVTERTACKKHTISFKRMHDWWSNCQCTSSTNVPNEKEMQQIISDALFRPYKATEDITYAMWQSVIRSTSINDAFDPIKGLVYQDMSKPLPHYFMASSHNTYLEGDQLTSSSSVKRYIDDLLDGCRCVELDCWDGDSAFNNQPIIYHGMTLTSKILFEDVIKAIKEHGFTKSSFPIVLSIENHCSVPQQQIMVQILKSVLGDALALPSPEYANELPSPLALQGKVLIKGKRSKDVVTEDDDDDEVEENGSPESNSKKELKEKTKMLKEKKNSGKHDVAPELSAITFLGTGKVKSFDATSMAIAADVMCSYSEGKTLKNLSKAAVTEGWINHNSKHMSRIYPKGTRVDSSNYNPAPAWAAGNQMVALNYQTKDVPFFVNYGKYRENGKCGFVLKPPYMLNPGSGAGPSAPINMVVHVLSAAQLPKPGGATKGEIIDPFVQVGVHGTPADEKEYKTSTIQDNGFNPVWNKVFKFRIESPDVAILSFIVMEDDVARSEFIAFSSLPVSCIRPGLRTLPLFSAAGTREGDFLFATLCVRIFFE